MWLTSVVQAFSNHLYTFITWLGDFVRDSKTGKPSVKRYGLALAVTVICGVMLGMGIGVVIVLMRVDNTNAVQIVTTVCDTLVWLAGAVLTAVTTGYVWDRRNERLASSPQQNQQADNPVG